MVFLRIRCAQFYAKKSRCKLPLSKALGIKTRRAKCKKI
ncbi:hypothetical protein [uncultured Gammaproteobacteria bacterium]|nr:hypothetical protein [uncultured Gammaproteobacteria bacterium]